jgi:hypothetical protein
MTLKRVLIVCAVVLFSLIVAIYAVLLLVSFKPHRRPEGATESPEFCRDEQGRISSRGAQRLSPNGAIERCDADGTWKPIRR